MKILQKLTSFDKFKKPVRLNFKGREEIGTFYGVAVSVLLTALLCAYSVEKFLQMVNRDNTNIQVNVVPDSFDSVDFVELDKIGFKIAFTVMNFKTREVLDDPTYVQWNVYMHERDFFESEKTKRALGYRKCSEEDYAAFF
jgi:hypothetical protein